jgi:hypothetical protein
MSIVLGTFLIIIMVSLAVLILFVLDDFVLRGFFAKLIRRRFGIE